MTIMFVFIFPDVMFVFIFPDVFLTLLENTGFKTASGKSVDFEVHTFLLPTLSSSAREVSVTSGCLEGRDGCIYSERFHEGAMRSSLENCLAHNKQSLNCSQ